MCHSAVTFRSERLRSQECLVEGSLELALSGMRVVWLQVVVGCLRVLCVIEVCLGTIWMARTLK